MTESVMVLESYKTDEAALSRLSNLELSGPASDIISEADITNVLSE